MNPTTSDSLQKRGRGRPPKQASAERVTDEREREEPEGEEIDVTSDPMGLDHTIAERGHKAGQGVDDIGLDSEIKYAPEKETAKIARTLSQFQNMILQAKMAGLKEIEASVDLHKHFQKQNYRPGIGYMYYQDIIVFEEGQREAVIDRNKTTMKQLLFGHSTAKIGSPIMSSDKKG